VALARAVVREPRVFLFDEPLSNLDAAMRLRTRAEIRQLHQRLRVSSVYVTHDQEEAMALADLVGVMAHGKLQQVASPLDIYERPANRFVAGFVGSPPMNFVEGKLLDAPGGGLTMSSSIGISASVALDAGSRMTSSPVVLGIRPTAIEIVPSARVDGPHAARAAAQIEAIEPLGEHMDVALRCGPERLVARVPASRGLAIGQSVALAIDLSRSHLFESGPLGARLEAALRAHSKHVPSDTLIDTRSVSHGPIHSVMS
jgi:ABC-type sugar transport system ATPase subunit